MNITNIINEIENLENPTDRCIAYSEVIVYLKSVRSYHRPLKVEIDWQNNINTKLVEGVHKSIDDKIEELKHLIEITIEHK